MWPAPPPQPPAHMGAAKKKRAHACAPGRRTDRTQRSRVSTNRSGMGGHAPHGQHNASDARFVAFPGKAEGRKEAERPPAQQAPPRPHSRRKWRTPPPPQPAPQHKNAMDPPRGAQPPQGQSRAPTPARPSPQRGPRQPNQWTGSRGRRSARPQTPHATAEGTPPGTPCRRPHNPKPSRGEPGPDRPPPQARQTEQGTGAGHAEGHGPRGTALPAPSAGTTRDARAKPPSGGGSGHHERDTRGLPEGQPDRARGTHRPHGMAYQPARVTDTRTGRPATRSAENGGGEGETKETRRQVPARTPPNRPRAPRTHRRGTVPAKAVVAHSATPQPLG